MDLINYLLESLKGELRQTHTSFVILLEDVVYKIKKPVNFGFLDYSTLEKRKHFCQREVYLNRRLCEDIYLGVVPISKTNGGYRVEDDTNVVEYAVKMKRIREEELLINRLDRVSEEDLRRILFKLKEFYSKAERRPEFGKLEVMKQNTDENFLQTEKFIGVTLSREDYEFIKSRTEKFYSKHGQVFKRRVEEGKVIDGHGDIRLEHVALFKDKVCIFDCIEFNERFRCLDHLNDFCFLTMELDYYGKEELSNFLEREYKAIMGEGEDYELLLPFFKAYRAYVRGKVNSFLLEDKNLSEEERERAKVRAKKFFELSRSYAGRISL